MPERPSWCCYERELAKAYECRFARQRKNYLYRTRVYPNVNREDTRRRDWCPFAPNCTAEMVRKITHYGKPLARHERERAINLQQLPVVAPLDHFYRAHMRCLQFKTRRHCICLANSALKKFTLNRRSYGASNLLQLLKLSASSALSKYQWN